MKTSHPSIIQRSEYVAMRDGVRLAVDLWLPGKFKQPDRLPCIFMTTRYWRSAELFEDNPQMQMGIYPTVKYFTDNGIAVLVADARGSGASFGTRKSELSDDEIRDMGELLDWAENEPWSNGKFAGFGISYGGNTTFLSAVNNHPALKVLAPQFADFDVYTQLYCPGGIPNDWMRRTWGESTRNMDTNNFAAMVKGQPSEELFLRTAKGVRPVDADHDRSLLRAAVAEHDQNFNAGNAPAAVFKDDSVGDGVPTFDARALYRYRAEIEASGLPIFYRAGWHDAGTADGALALFATFSNPMHVMIGPWNHGMTHIADPFAERSEERAGEITVPDMLGGVLEHVVPYIGSGTSEPSMKGKRLDYFTLGENKWKSTGEWPLPETVYKTLYLGTDGALGKELPATSSEGDSLAVNPDTTFGPGSRWHTQMSGPVLFPDRRGAASDMLCYQSPALVQDIEITGHPIADLYVRSDAEDGFFFVYLEDVSDDGTVKTLTDGYLRALHRNISDETPPYRRFGPYHSYKRADAAPMVPGELCQLQFALMPISVVVKRGHRLRFGITGANKDVFPPLKGCETPTITVERNQANPSHIVLPVIPREGD